MRNRNSISSVNADKKLKAYRQTIVTDWSGQLLNKRAFKIIRVGCYVRVCVNNTKNNSSEAIYFKIIKIKDGTLWGITQNTYRMKDMIGLENDSVYKFRFNEISEIPINWQPRAIRKKLKSLLDQRGYGRSMTGL